VIGGLFAVVGVIGILAGFATLLFGFATLAKIKATSAWPSVDGVVVASGTIVHVHTDSEHRLDETRMHEPTVRYEYEVDGRKYSGDRITLARVARTGDFAAAMLARYPVGEGVRVHYDPKDPKSAVLRPGDTRGIEILFTVAVGFIAIGASFVWWGVSH
jgi:hypothetical protein